MSKSRLSSTATTPDLDLNNIQLENLMDIRHQINTNDRRFHNVNYVRNVLRRFFGNYIKKSSSINSDDNFTDQQSLSINDNLISPILIHPCLQLQFDKHTKFSGELLFEWFLMHFEGRYENLTLIKQVILQCCTCLIGLDVLQNENTSNNDLFHIQNLYSWTTNKTKDDENTDIKLLSLSNSNNINQHLIKSKEPSATTTIFDILRSEYGFHSDVQQIESHSVSIQVNLINNINTFEKSIQTDFILISPIEQCLTDNLNPMSSFIVSKTDSNNKPSSPISTHHTNENTVRQAMHNLFLHDIINDSTLAGDNDDDDDDDDHNVRSPGSFENNHTKFTNDLLLEWITLNSNSRNSNTQALIERVKSCLHPNSNNNFNLSISKNQPHELLSSGNKQLSSFEFNSGIKDDVGTLLTDLVLEIDKKSAELSSSSSISIATSSVPPPPPPPPPPPFFAGVTSAIMCPGIPPPPPPMMPGFGAPPQLPQYLQRKQKYSVTEPVKKVQWSKINPYTIKKDSMWVHVDEEKYVNDTLFSDIRKNFASKVVPSRHPIHDLVDKSKELRVLDAKAAQNFAIMFSQLKVPPLVFREWMLSCDNEYLKYDFLKQLEKYLPTSDELKTLADFKNEINDLQYSEQYFCAIGDIKRLKQRLKTLLFKANYKETVEETDKAFVEVRTACDHVRHSIRFKKMLELILTVGNYMNSSAKTYEPVHGFDISFLPKLHSTKANDGRRSLLHFIVQAIENKHRDLLSFSDEFYLLADGVSKINILELQKQPQEINRELKNAREELAITKHVEEQIEGDRFADAIEDFIIRADDDVARLEQLDEEVTNSYQNLCDFLAIDPKNYSLTEFFTDLKLFCTFFSTCLQEIRVWREQAARTAKTTNSQLFAEKKILDIPDDSPQISRRTLSRVEHLIEKRKSNRGLTPPLTSNKKRSQS